MLPVKDSEVTCIYGKVNPEVWKSKGYHTGIDFISVTNNRNIHSVLEGEVIEANSALGNGFDPTGWGNYVIVRVRNKWDLIYAHLSDVKVRKGQLVSEGDILGTMGATGNTYGMHLHFEVREIHWLDKNELNPAVFLGIYNRLGLSKTVPKEEEKMVRPSTGNITLLNGEVGYIETLPDRVIIHYDEHTYMCIWDGKITLHAKGKNSVQLI